MRGSYCMVSQVRSTCSEVRIHTPPLSVSVRHTCGWDCGIAPPGRGTTHVESMNSVLAQEKERDRMKEKCIAGQQLCYLKSSFTGSGALSSCPESLCYSTCWHDLYINLNWLLSINGCLLLWERSETQRVLWWLAVCICDVQHWKKLSLLFIQILYLLCDILKMLYYFCISVLEV